ncbi:MAG: TRAP transporter substrate-binding protein [Rhodobacter sp.]|nr:TRAP transporter substrate-binding protein [Rhodobacter sp.]
MDRRSFLKKSTVGGTAAAAATLAAPAYAQGNRTLTMVQSVPHGFAIFDDAAVYFNNAVAAMSDGSLTIDKKAAGELVGAFEVFDAVTAGQADVYHSADYYFGGQHPGYYYFTAVPFGGTAQELTTWYLHGGGMELHDELGQIFGLKSFLCGNTTVQPGGWFREPINSAADLQGLKFRMPGLGGQALGNTGASVQSIPGGEIYQALASGAIDAAEWIGPFADERLGFQEICKYYYTAGFHEPGSALSVAFNRDIWDDLSPAHQAICETAAVATSSWSIAQSNHNNGAALQRIQSAGVNIVQFSDEIWDAFGTAAKQAMDAYMDDPLYVQIRESFETSMRSSSGWLSRSEGEYVRQRDRVLGAA